MPPNFNSTPCVQSFEDFGESVYDICWSPTHPALFSSVDGEGRFSLWNLNSNLEVFIIIFFNWFLSIFYL